MCRVFCSPGAQDGILCHRCVCRALRAIASSLRQQKLVERERLMKMRQQLSELMAILQAWAQAQRR
jgi:hypothetical protein